MDMYKLLMLIAGFTMVNNNVTSSSSDGKEKKKIEVEIEFKNLPKLPPGYHFVPLYSELILGFLVKKIMGLPLASDLVKVMDGAQLLDPEQHDFENEFAHCLENYAYYITNKSKTEGGSKTRTIIKTTSGYWREKKKDVAVYNGDQIIGYKKTYIFYRGKNDKTSWRMYEFTVNPETIPAYVRAQIEESIACQILVKEPKTKCTPICECESCKEEEDDENDE